MTIIQVTNQICSSCAAGSPTLRSLRRAIRPGDAPLVGQQVLQAQVQRGPHPRDHARPSDNPSVVRFARAHLARQAGYSDDTSVRTESLLGAAYLVCAVLILLFFAPVSKLEARYCGQPFDVQAARIRWTNARQSRPRSEEPDQICRAYFNQFYEAVQARQAVSECAEAGVRKTSKCSTGRSKPSTI